MKRSIKKKFRFGFNFFTLFLIYFTLIFFAAVGREIYDIYKGNKNEVVSEEKEEDTESTQSITTPLKDKVVLNVPYTVQAPLANWKIHEESCEEAAVLMIHYYLEDISVPGTVIPKEKADKELTDMVNWQKANYGKEADLDMTALGKLAKDYYGHSFEVKKNVTKETIKEVISSGYLLVVPVMTHGLQNPHYSRTSVYHVVLIKGYDESGVIANDAGVKEGENYHYSWDILWNAIDQQTPKMNQGRDILILKK